LSIANRTLVLLSIMFIICGVLVIASLVALGNIDSAIGKNLDANTAKTLVHSLNAIFFGKPLSSLFGLYRNA